MKIYIMKNMSSPLFQFFDIYERLLTSSNYVTRRQSLKVLFAPFLVLHSSLIIMFVNSETIHGLI